MEKPAHTEMTRLSQPWHNLGTRLPQCNLVITLAQPCILNSCKVVTKWWQGCTNKVVRTLSQACHNSPCHNLGTTLYFELLQCCDEVVARLLQRLYHKVVQTLSQSCHKVATIHLVTTLYFETVARLLQGGSKAVTKALSQPCIMKL